MRHTLLELIQCLALGMLIVNALRRVQLIELAEQSNDGPEGVKQIIMLCLVGAGIFFLVMNLYKIHEARMVQKMWDEADNEESDK